MVTTVTTEDGTARRCVCGQMMQQVETVPAMSYFGENRCKTA
jgi:hypothetical protein